VLVWKELLGAPREQDSSVTVMIWQASGWPRIRGASTRGFYPGRGGGLALEAENPQLRVAKRCTSPPTSMLMDCCLVSLLDRFNSNNVTPCNACVLQCQRLNHLTSFHETWHEHCASGGHSNAESFNRRQSVISWRTLEPMALERHYRCRLWKDNIFASKITTWRPWDFFFLFSV